jgi:pentatricopeptide repeat protein
MFRKSFACHFRSFASSSGSFRLRQRRFWASTSHDGTEHLSEEHRLAQKLIHNQSLPEGSYRQLDFISASRLIRVFKNRTDPTSVNLAIRLWERLQRESFLTKDENFDESRVIDETDLIALVSNWRLACKKGEPVMSPNALMQKMQNLSQQFPQFSHPVKVFSMIMDVALHTVRASQSPDEASLMAEEFLEFIEDTDDNSLGQSLRPNVYIYSQALKAHAESGRPDTPKKLDAVLEQMERNGVELTVVTFNILLRFYAGRGDAAQIEDLLDAMREKGLSPSRTSLAQAIYGYCHARKTDKAEALLNEMVQITPHNRTEERLIGECILNILFAYRRVIADKSTSGLDKVRAMGAAEDLVRRMEKFAMSGDDESSKFIVRKVLVTPFSWEAYNFLLLNRKNYWNNDGLL